jgi:hypothetical protein
MLTKEFKAGFRTNINYPMAMEMEIGDWHEYGE